MADDKDTVERLKRLGYRIRKPGEYTKNTLVVHTGTLTTFKERAKELDYRIQDAVTEALDEWIERRKGLPTLKKG